MKRIASMLVVLLVLGALLPIQIDVQADESKTDWENTDWETVDWRNMDDEGYDSLAEWLRTDADMDTMLMITTTTGDGWVGELWATVLSRRFQQEPYVFIQSLSKLDEAVIVDTAYQIAYFGFRSKDEAEAFFGALTLPQNLTGAEKHALDVIIETTEEVLNLELPNPKTGDPIGIVMAAMALCCAGAAGLICRRRNVLGK